MFLKKKIEKSTLDTLAQLIDDSNAIIIGAGAGLSACAGFTYNEQRFMKYFADFNARYGIKDMYFGGFYPFENECEYWSFWARKIYYNRYFDEIEGINNLYEILLNLVKDKKYFVLTTNVDHQFQKNNFDKTKLFYTQGDYGLFQCEVPCKQETYSNKETILEMLKSQKGMQIDPQLIPKCPSCGENLTINLRKDDKFVQDEEWDLSHDRYIEFLNENLMQKTLFLELGVGMNTPGIIKYPFIKMTSENANTYYVSINIDDQFNTESIKEFGFDITDRSLFINGDIYEVLSNL